MTRAAAMLAAGVMAASGCALHRFVPPAGAGVPAPDGLAAFQQATVACRSATTFSAQMHVSGKAGGQRLRGTIDGALTSTDQIYLRANAPFGQTAFVLAGTAESATLLLPHDNRVLTARAVEIVEALTGLAWGPSELRDVLSGCVAGARAMGEPTRVGDHLHLKTADADVYLVQRRGAWEVEGGVLKGLAIGYANFSGGWPHQVTIASRVASPDEIALKIVLEQIDTAPVPDAAFVASVPADAVPLKLDELRRTFGIRGH